MKENATGRMLEQGFGIGFPGFSSHRKGTEITSLSGGTMAFSPEEIGFASGSLAETEGIGLGIQSVFAMPGFFSQRNGTEIVWLPYRR